MEPGERPLHRPPVGARSGALPGAAADDRGHDAEMAHPVAVDVLAAVSGRRAVPAVRGPVGQSTGPLRRAVRRDAQTPCSASPSPTSSSPAAAPTMRGSGVPTTSSSLSS